MKVTTRISGLNENVDREERDIVLGWLKQSRGNMPHLSEFTWTKDGAYRVVVYRGAEPVSFLKII